MKTTYAWKGVRCTVEAPAAVGRRVAALFSELVRPGPGPVDIRVDRGPGGFAMEGLEGDAWETVSETVSATELALTRRLLALEREHTHLHAAAALTEGGEAVLALGPSGSGKSSVAYAWYRMGRPVFGDDVVALDAEARLHPFPRPLKVDVARMREAGEAPEETVAWDGRAPDAWVDPTLGAGWAPGGVPVRLVAEIRFVAGAPLQLTPVTGGERLRVLLDAVHQTGVPRSRSVDRLITVAEGAKVIRLEHGDARTLAAALLEWAGEARH